MSIELKEAAGKALVVLGSATSFMSRKARDQHESVAAELRTAIQQAESAPVAFGIRESNKGRICQFVSSDDEDEVAQLGEYRKGIVVPLYTHPAPGVPDTLKDHQIAAMVNTLRDIARQFHGHDSLRERIANVLVPALKAEAQHPAASEPDDVVRDAERFRTLMRAIPGQIAEAICGRPNVPDDDIIEAIDALASPAQKGGE